MAGVPDNFTFNIVEAGPHIADEDLTRTLAVTVRDGLGALVPGALVQLNWPLDPSAVSIINDITDAFGVAQFTIKSPRSMGSYAYSAFILSNGLYSQQEVINYTAGPEDSFTIDITGANEIEANGISSTTVKVTVSDKSGNPILGKPVQINFPILMGSVAGGVEVTAGTITSPTINTAAPGSVYYTVTSGTTIGRFPITSTNNLGTKQTYLTLTPGALTNLEIAVTGFNKISADGKSKTTLRAAATDIKAVSCGL